MPSMQRRRLHRSLIRTTALAGGLLATTPLAAQSLPSANPATWDATTNPGTLLNPSADPGISRTTIGGKPTLSVDLRATSTVIDWKDGFNIPQDSAAVFNDGRGAASKLETRNIAVLNRDLTGTESHLLGSLSSDSNVAVWVYNPNGILVGSKAVVNTGSLVLTTLAPDQNDFLGGGGTYRLTATADSQARIKVDLGANITLKNGGNRGLILVAPQIDAVGAFAAGEQDVAFVTATDVTLAYDTGSPLSVTLNRGTTVAQHRGQLVGGSVGGRNVLFALAAQGTVTDALLQVDASVTTATSSSRGIVLSAGKPATPAGGVTVGGDDAATGGVAALSTNGALVSRAAGAGVTARASGALTLAGAVTTGGDYLASGSSVVLGGATAVRQQANGAVAIEATGGTLAGTAGLVLQVNADGTRDGAETLSLITSGTVGGDLAFAAGSSLIGGSTTAGVPNRESDLVVRVRDASNAVALGDVNANELKGAVGTGALSTGLATDGALTLGNVAVRGPLVLASGALTAGTLQSGGDVTLRSNGIATITSIRSDGAVALSGGRLNVATISGGSVLLDGSQGVVATGPLTASAGDLGVAGDSVSLTSLGASGRVTVTARGGDAVLASARSGDAFALEAAGAVQVGAAIVAGGDYAISGRSVTVAGLQQAGGSLTLRALDGSLTGSTGTALKSGVGGAAAGALTLSALGGVIALDPASSVSVAARQGGVSVTTDGGAVTLGAVDARSLTVEMGSGTAGAALTTGNLGVNDSLLLNAGAGAVRTGTIAVANGSATLTGGGIATQDITAAGVTLTATGPGAAGAISAGRVMSAGAVRVATTGGGAVVLGQIVATTPAGDVTVASTGGVRLGGVDASGIASVTTSGAVADVIVTDGVAAIGSATVTSTRDVRTPSIVSRTGDLTVTATNGAVTGLDGLSAVALGTGPGRGFSIQGANDLRLGALTGGPVVLSGRSISVGPIDAGTDAVTLDAVSGDLSVGGDIKGGDVTARSSATTRLRAVTASGAVTLAGTTALSFTDISGTTIDAVSQGALAGTSANASRDLALTGTSIGLNVAAAAGDVTLLATAGPLGLQKITAGGGTTATATGPIGIVTLKAASATLASLGDSLALGDASVGGDLALGAAQRIAVTGPVIAGGDYTVRGGDVSLGGAAATAGGRIDVTATTGAITGDPGLALTSDGRGGAGTLVLDAAGGVTLGGTILRAGDAAIGLRAGAGQPVTLGRIEAGSIGGVDAAHADFSAPFVHDGAVTTGDLSARRVALSLTSGNLATGTIASSGSVLLATAGGASVTTGDITAGTLSIAAGGALMGGAYRASGDIGLGGDAAKLTSAVSTDGTLGIATKRDLSVGTIDGARGATLNVGGAARVDMASGATLRIDTGGDLGGLVAGRAALAATGGDLAVTAGGALRLASVSSTGGGVMLSATDIDVAGKLAAARALLVAARAALTLTGPVSAGADLSLQARGAIDAGAVDAAGPVTIAGGDVRVASIASGAALSVKADTFTGTKATAATGLTLTSAGALSLGEGTAGASATIDAGGLATLGALSAGPSLTLRAADAELTGVQRAAAIAIENRAYAGTALRLGDGTAANGFRLTDAEVARLAADTVTFDQSGGAVEIGTLNFTADAGRREIAVLTTGSLTVDGVVSGSGVGRTFRLGGSSGAETDTASSLAIVSTAKAGGRLLFGDADLELRGNRIAAGLAPGFVDALAGSGADVTGAYVANPSSTLYNAAFGGGVYDPTAPTILTARSLTVRYGDYALLQNTSGTGQSSGVILGGTAAAPVKPALTLLPTAGTMNSFALFGTINGIGTASASLLGPEVIVATGASLATSRINGCLIGSGGGCLAATVIKPTLQVFDLNRDEIFGVVVDLAVPFEPVVGGTNEELIAGIDVALPNPTIDVPLSPIVPEPDARSLSADVMRGRP